MRRAPRSPVQVAVSFAASLAVIASAGLAVVAAEQSADAASTTSAATILKSFDPGDIIADEVMFNPSTMTQSAIQTFLDTQVPTCRSGYTCLKSYTQTTVTKPADPMCSTYTGATNETAATIIYRVAKACGVNPQVLLVTLEKEQGLITDDWPSTRQYRSATGYGCPDTAACDSDYYGFFNQVYKAAWAFKRYTTPAGTTGPGWTKYDWFPIGRPSGVLFNPDPSCGASTVTIKNKATAVLYYFTPYQPNPAAISAGYGAAPPCGAYGNRNFFLYFTTWFGSTHYSVSGAIGTLWRSMGGSSSAVGNPVGNASTVTTAGGGTVQRFTKGTIYSSAAGTLALSTAVLTEYLAAGGPGGSLGWPRALQTTSKDNGGGVIQPFQNGSIFSSGAGAHAVSGAIYLRYSKESFQAGSLQWPTADAVVSTANGGGAWQTFTGGRISAAAGGTGIIVTGAVLTKYVARGAEASSLGWPTADATTAKARASSLSTRTTTGTVQQFQLGQVQAVGTSVRTVTGNLANDYARNGGATGSFGFATTVAHPSPANGGGWYQSFAGGKILYSLATGAHPLRNKELALYTARGGVTGSLGWPGSRVRDASGPGGYVTAFTNGSIYSSKAGTVPVLGDILKKYLAKKGPGGVLGWPTGPAAKVKGVLVQPFEHGSITWTGSGGAVAHRS